MSDTEKSHLQTLREAAGYGTQVAAANRFGVSSETWGRWERGEKKRDIPKAVLDLLEIEAARRAEDGEVAQ